MDEIYSLREAKQNAQAESAERECEKIIFYEMHLAAMQGVFLLQKVHLYVMCRSCIFANCML